MTPDVAATVALDGLAATLAQLTDLESVFGAGERLLQVLGIALLSAATAAVVAAVHRWYARDRLGGDVAVLFGLAAAALYLNVRAALGQVVAGETAMLAGPTVAFNAVALGAALLAAPVGGRAGDRLAEDVVGVPGTTELEAGVGALVASIGRGTAVTLPAEIERMDGHEAVPAAVTERLAGSTLVFGGTLRDEELRGRLLARLKDEPGVAHVDLEVEGTTVTHLALGARLPGIGPTLGPGTAAVAVRADPPPGAGPGDLVQLWTPGAPPAPAPTDGGSSDGRTTDGTAPATPDRGEDAPRRVLTAELRGVAGDVVTLACDADEAPRVAGREFRLVTLPADRSADRTFTSLLRAADETMGAIAVADESALVGVPVGAIDATVVAVQPVDGAIEPIPARSRPVAAGETLYVVARPEALRRLEREGTAAAAGAESAGPVTPPADD